MSNKPVGHNHLSNLDQHHCYLFGGRLTLMLPNKPTVHDLDKS